MDQARSGVQPTKEKAQQVKQNAQDSQSRLRTRYPSLDHLLRANEAFGERYGNHYAAAITYFSVLSLIPILMVAFAIVGFILAGNPALLAELTTRLTGAAPPGLGDTIEEVVQTAIDARATVGVLGLATALYAGIGWMRNLRDALTAQWGQQKPKQPLVSGMVRDLLSLFGLGAALIVSFALTVAGGVAGNYLLAAVGLDSVTAARVALGAFTLALALLANWLVFLWVIARLPRERVSVRSAVKGAVIAAVGFEILKQLASVFISSVMTSPTGALFGPIIGLLVFANLVSRFLLFVTAWTATAKENIVETVQPPAPTVIRPLVAPQLGPSAAHTAGLLGIGGILGIGVGRLWRKRASSRR